jgi:hypothetical protein
MGTQMEVMEVAKMKSLFEAIVCAVDELQKEAYRITHADMDCVETIKTGELQKILDNARKSTRLLKEIRFRDGGITGMTDRLAITANTLRQLQYSSGESLILNPAIAQIWKVIEELRAMKVREESCGDAVMYQKSGIGLPC